MNLNKQMKQANGYIKAIYEANEWKQGGEIASLQACRSNGGWLGFFYTKILKDPSFPHLECYHIICFKIVNQIHLHLQERHEYLKFVWIWEIMSSNCVKLQVHKLQIHTYVYKIVLEISTTYAHIFILYKCINKPIYKHAIYANICLAFTSIHTYI